jgi:hypothetical protein
VRRVVVNDALRARQDAHAAGEPCITDAELPARLTASMRTPERAWLSEVSSVVLQQALTDLNAAYRNVAKAAGLAVTACGAQVRPEPLPAQRGEAGTHSKLCQEEG